ncbi:metallophosphoesterase [Rhodoblastus acidophilus]|uniref:Metallophosphoesterase n=1 Tax=Candidatus Rhodoblastus alkanivorans TaxID=2954117 RepID=A0ABS9Z5F4_9HYPH|nr:metallophosphoesterase [Candidatus Rhodoblastus alkanivorans]MCI4679264.1 metallophosphoesterase [Candidatus Rhodoblastus alkanivorans]MCI4682412.1 metallophosphoesterase [Candidatus Rhodoblastus alkanivorans]MDI4639717.1 metallophosphoesterase [Rhodoblastus acidophilus]
MFRLAHLSDAHIGPLPRPRWRELIGKRATGYLNWRRGRSRAHDMEVLGALVADMREQGPDHVAMTGDICNIGLPAEYPLAAQWLATLGAPEDVSLAPGNHDAYMRSSLHHMARDLSPWTSGDDGAQDFPFLRRRNGVAIIGLCSGIPTLPFVAAGKLGQDQLRRLAEILRDTRDEIRVVLIHHPPVDGGGGIRNLGDHRALAEILAKEGAELVLHGHIHSISRKSLPGPRGPIPVLGICSASSVGRSPRRRAAYYLIDIDAGSRRMTLTARQLDQAGHFRQIAL